MAEILDGKAASAAVRAQLKEEVASLKEKGITPGLAVIIVGDDPASRIYVNNKKKACAEVGIYSEEFALPGLGIHFVNSITNRDYTAIMGVTIFYAAFLIAMIFIVDIFYCLIDPRIKYE